MRLAHLFESSTPVDIASITQYTDIAIDENSVAIIPMVITPNLAVNFVCAFTSETCKEMGVTNFSLAARLKSFRRKIIHATNGVNSYATAAEKESRAEEYEDELTNQLKEFIDDFQKVLPMKAVFGNKTYAWSMHQLRKTIESLLEKPAHEINQVYANSPVKIFLSPDSWSFHIGVGEIIKSLGIIETPHMQQWVEKLKQLEMPCDRVAIVKCEDEYLLIMDKYNGADDVAFTSSTRGGKIACISDENSSYANLRVGEPFMRHATILKKGIKEVLEKHMQAKVSDWLVINFLPIN